MRRPFVVLLFLFCAGIGRGLEPNCMFADNMVVQRGLPVPVWGTASPGEQVAVEFCGQKKTAKTDGTGKWSLSLEPLAENARPSEMLIRGSGTTVVLKNLLVGEVWLCSGQSNMEWALARSDGGPEAIASASNPLLRMCRIPHNAQMTPQASVGAKWEEVTPQSAKNFSAIPYWFGEKLQKELGCPVGIINSAFGGTTIQSWMPAEALKNDLWPKDRWSDLALAKAEYDKKAEAARPLKAKYEADKAAALAQKLPAPTPPPGLVGEFKGPTTLWNGEVGPILPFGIRGVAWYQGENNSYANGIAIHYKDLLPVMIREWRTGFGQTGLPFIIVQIARNRKWQTDPNEESGIATLQEAQAKVALATKNAALVVTTDKGGPDVHYTAKEPIGERVMKAALALAHQRPSAYCAPIFKELKIEGSKAVLSFSNAEGLLAQGDKPEGFVIAGKDHKFVFANARIDGEKVVVSSPEVPVHEAVRYGWADLPKVNLFNGAGLPASTFRTDDWPLK